MSDLYKYLAQQHVTTFYVTTVHTGSNNNSFELDELGQTGQTGEPSEEPSSGPS
jgi:hypothetical protein